MLVIHLHTSLFHVCFFSICCVKRYSRFHLSEYLIWGKGETPATSDLYTTAHFKHCFQDCYLFLSSPKSLPTELDLPRPLPVFWPYWYLSPSLLFPSHGCTDAVPKAHSQLLLLCWIILRCKSKRSSSRAGVPSTSPQVLPTSLKAYHYQLFLGTNHIFWKRWALREEMIHWPGE